MKDNTVELVKFRALKRLLDLPDYQVVGVLESLWMFARKNSWLGDVGKFTNLDIAAAIEWKGDENQLVEALTTSRWLDSSPGESRLVCHDWYDHAPSFIVRRINNFLRVGETRTPTDAGRDAWRSKMLGRNSTIKAPDVGASDDQKRPAGAQNKPETAPLAHARIPNPTQPNPTTPVAPGVGASRASESESVGCTWESLSSELEIEGMDFASEACRTAKANGNLPSEARKLLEHWRRYKPAWPIGTLYNKFMGLRPGRNVTWPELPADVARQEQRGEANRAADKTTADLRRERAEGERQRAADLAERDRLEASHGAELNALPRKDLRRLIESASPEQAEFYIGTLPAKGPPKPGALRTDLLRYLETTSTVKV